MSPDHRFFFVANTKVALALIYFYSTAYKRFDVEALNSTESCSPKSLATPRSPANESALHTATVVANVWFSGSRAVSHEPHRTKQMHLFSQLEEFANVRTRVNSLVNLHQT